MQSETSVRSAASPQPLSAQGQASLRAILEARNLPVLRWPDFSDYAPQLQKFYAAYGYALPWVRGREPTVQAQQIIALLSKSEQKGLSAEDYDGPRWGDRVASLKAASPQPSEADEVRFDVNVVDRPLAEIMINAKNLRLGEGSMQNPVELLRGRECVSDQASGRIRDHSCDRACGSLCFERLALRKDKPHPQQEPQDG
jgi:Scaffold domain